MDINPNILLWILVGGFGLLLVARPLMSYYLRTLIVLVLSLTLLVSLGHLVSTLITTTNSENHCGQPKI